ncbi:MAG: cation:proton antiporter [Desulfuromonadaceae bacterium]|nr:cation:proton antiporter [Desulfuromonadaceae bacterium]
MRPELFLLNIGAIFLLGIATDYLGRRTPLPRVTLLLLFGLLIGPSALALTPELFVAHFELVADLALVLVGFLLGGRLASEVMKQQTRQIIFVSLVEASGDVVVIAVGLILCGFDPALAIILGCVASATAPAATLDVMQEMEAEGPFVSLLTGVVALDDAWGLILFSLGLAVSSSLVGEALGIASVVAALWQIGGAVVLGVALGVPAAFLTGRLKPGQPILTEALGLVFVCGGLALWFEVSFLIASMVMGGVVAHRARHHEYPFHAIQDVEGPILVLFFVLAGATLELESLQGIGAMGILYLLLRAVGKIGGAWLGSRLSGVDRRIGRWLGVALLPQAGVAIGMALVAANRLPQYRSTLLTVVIGSTVVFELIGPVLTRLAINRTRGFSV